MKYKSWMIYLIIFLLALVVMYFMGNKSVHHEIVINKSSEKVWEVLTDIDRYKEWNPVMELLEGKIKEGNQVKYRFTQDENNVSEIPSKVKKIIPNKLLNQGGGLPFVITFDHKYILEKKGEGIHHIAFAVDDIYEEMERLETAGFKLIHSKPKKGADNKLIAFLHPKSTNGVLIELCQDRPSVEEK